MTHMTYEPVPQRQLPHAPLQTFKVRRGRRSARHEDALLRLFPLLGVRVGGRPLDLATLFGRDAPRVLDVGSGMGEATAAAAAADPGRDVLAVEVHTPGIANLLGLVEEQGLTNVRVADGDARVLLGDMLGPDSLDEVRVWFPDPWPKARHAKRRLVSAAFLDLLAGRLRSGGVLWFATDWPSYAELVDGLVAAHDGFEVVTAKRRPPRPRTRFEIRGDAAGRPAVDLVARRR